MCNDQGPEFNKSLIESIKNAIGVEHILTSRYNPRAIGQVERFNQTLMEALRKHAENDRSNLHLWLPYVLMAYRTRIHSATGFTPFELMFGRQMKTFVNWNSKPNEVDSLLKRTDKIRNMFENTLPKAIENVQKGKEKQKIIQNKANNVSYTPSYSF